jgi:hypothetical protein
MQIISVPFLSEIRCQIGVAAALAGFLTLIYLLFKSGYWQYG